VTSGSSTIAFAEIEMKRGKEKLSAAAKGDGLLTPVLKPLIRQ